VLYLPFYTNSVNKAFLEAVRNNNLSQVKNLITTRSWFISPRNREYSLILAAIHNNLDMIKIIAEMPGDPISSIERGLALRSAAAHNNLDMVRFIAEIPGDPISAEDRRLALMNAAHYNNLDMVRFIAEMPGDPIYNEDLIEALFYALFLSKKTSLDEEEAAASHENRILILLELFSKTSLHTEEDFFEEPKLTNFLVVKSAELRIKHPARSTEEAAALLCEVYQYLCPPLK
jgi:ankyrin repeat protein